MKKYMTMGLFCLSAGACADGLDVKSYGKWAHETSDASTDATGDEAEQTLADTPESQSLPTQETATESDAAPTADDQDVNAAPAPETSQDMTSETDPETMQNMMAAPVPTEDSAPDDLPMGDGGVRLATKPAMDRACGQTNLNTPWKNPNIEFTLLAGGSGSYIPVNEGLVDTSGLGAPARYRFHVSGEGFTGGLGVSAGYRRGNNTFGAIISGYLDSHTLKNYDAKNDIYSSNVNSSTTFLNRSYTLEFAGKAGHYFGDLHLYGKLGVICSAFQYKYRASGVDKKNNLTAWGGVAGVGLQKPITLPLLNDAKIGLEYDYHIYEFLTPVIKYSANLDTSKLRPRYHNGYLTISKTF